MGEPELVSVFICTRNRPDMIGAAVGSVLANDDPNFELIVVDQSSDTATEEALRCFRADPRLRYHHTSRVGKSAACNTAIAMSRGALLASTDDDCIVPPDWIRSIRSEFASYPDVDLLYGDVRVPRDWQDGQNIPSMRFSKRRRLGQREGFQLLGMGANIAFRRDVAQALGGFDELLGGGGYFGSSEDFDLQYRFFRHGFVSMVTPAVHVEHFGTRDNTEWSQRMFAYGFGDGAFYMKHIRCRDLYALRLYAKRVGREAAGLVAKTLLRRPCSSHYLRGLIRGAFASFGRPVDRRRRLYVAQ